MNLTLASQGLDPLRYHLHWHVENLRAFGKELPLGNIDVPFIGQLAKHIGDTSLDPLR